MPKPSHHLKGVVFAVISSLLVSLGFIFTKLILREVNPETSSIYFFGFGTLGSFLMLGVARELKQLKAFKTHAKPMLILGILGGIASLMWFYAIDLIGPSLTAFLMRFLVVFTVLWGILFFNERFNKLEILGMIIAAAGVVLISIVSGDGKFLSLGAVIALTTAFLFSIMQVIVKLYAGRVSPLVSNHWRLFLSFLILLLYGLTGQKIAAPTSSVLIFSLLGGILGGTIGVFYFYKALEITEISKVNIIRTMDPFVVVGYSYLVFQDIPTLKQMTGGILIVVGIILLILSRHRPKILARWIS